MVSHCSNTACGKPLLYLREGKIFLLEVVPAEASTGDAPRLEHFWLCGPCSQKYRVHHTGQGKVELIPRNKSRRPAPVLPEDALLAS